MIVLASAIILSLNNSNIIGKAKEGTFKNDMANIKELYNHKILEKFVQGNTEDLTEQEKDEILGKYKGKLQIVKGTLVGTKNTTDEEKDILNEQRIPDATNFDFVKGVNKPIIPKGTNINATNSAGELVGNPDSTDWYSYAASLTNNTNKNWANMKTADGSQWVWIPRYAYKITSGYKGEGLTQETTEYYGTIDVKFLIGDGDVASDGTKCVRSNTANKDYVVHPAFTFGDVELEGIWIAKYKARSSIAPTDVNDMNPEIIINNTGSGWTKLNLSNKFKKCREMETKAIYGWDKPSTGINEDGTDTIKNGIDTHMMKNTEWGAMAYFALSQYGLKHNNVSGTNNRYKNELTYGGYTTSGTNYGIYETTSIHEEVVATVYKNSTTGDIYGPESESAIIKKANPRYIDTYLTTDPLNRNEYFRTFHQYYGDAMSEVSIERLSGTYTSVEKWYKDAYFTPSGEGFAISRGGHSNGVSNSSSPGGSGNSLSIYLQGVLSSTYQYPNGARSHTFRPVLAVHRSL
ncbi:MAG: hypothetical protein PHR25_03850 [Clostridia bacterium]|nr:hypothetical protein [Clostridia bacterium]MDD4375896.1 hypothetical protein [Clostridia bacterium]